MKVKWKNYIAKLIIFSMIFINISVSILGFSQYEVLATECIKNKYEGKVNNKINEISNILMRKESKDLSDWEAIALGAAGKKISEDYLKEVDKKIREDYDDTFRVNTDYGRIILAVTAADGDTTNIGGINLINKLCEINFKKDHNLFAKTFAIIAMECGNFQVPTNSNFSKEKIVESILSKKNQETGGWNGINGVDPDTTAMTITGLSSYYEKNSDVKETVDDAIIALSKTMDENGEFKGSDKTTSASSESVSQTIIALCSIGKDPATHKDFIRKDKNLIDLLFEFETADGGFSHQKDAKMEDSNGMATEQGLLALIAYKNFIEGKKGSVYLLKNFDNIIPVEKILFEEDEITLKENEKHILKASVIPENASNKDIEWTSDNEDIAKVDMKGNITGISEGTTVITAITKDGNKMAKCKVKIVKNEKNIIEIVNLTPNSELKLGNEAEIQVKAINNFKEDKNFILIIALYNEEDNKMISYDLIEGMINGGEFENFKTKIVIPTHGKYNIKVFAWDDMENMNSLSNRIDMKIK